MFAKVESCLYFLAILVRADKETDDNPAQQYGSEIPAGDISDWSHCILRHLPMLSLPYLDWTIQNKGIIQTWFKKFIEGSCECYNPWLGETFQEHQGDPGKTCPTFCYVDCLGGCLDIKPAQEGGRCFSEEACKYGKFIHMSNCLVKKNNLVNDDHFQTFCKDIH